MYFTERLKLGVREQGPFSVVWEDLSGQTLLCIGNVMSESAPAVPLKKVAQTERSGSYLWLGLEQEIDDPFWCHYNKSLAHPFSEFLAISPSACRTFMGRSLSGHPQGPRFAAHDTWDHHPFLCPRVCLGRGPGRTCHCTGGCTVTSIDKRFCSKRFQNNMLLQIVIIQNWILKKWLLGKWL